MGTAKNNETKDAYTAIEYDYRLDDFYTSVDDAIEALSVIGWHKDVIPEDEDYYLQCHL